MLYAGRSYYGQSPRPMRRRYGGFFHRMNAALVEKRKRRWKFCPRTNAGIASLYLWRAERISVRCRACWDMLYTPKKYTHTDIDESQRNITRLAY